MKVAFSLHGIGWLSAQPEDLTESALVTASDLSDALGDLMLAVWTLLDGDSQARCSWQEEPGEYRWLFIRQADVATVRVFQFRDAFEPEPDHVGRLVFETTEPLASMGAAFADAADKLLDTYGIDGYRSKWMDGDFPEETLALIRQLLPLGRGDNGPN